MQERSEAERRAIWPCLNVATWRRERSDRAIQQIMLTSSNQVSYISAVTALKARKLNFAVAVHVMFALRWLFEICWGPHLVRSF